MASARPPAGMRPWSGRYAQQWNAATIAAYGTGCHLCGRDGATTADHLIPRSKGGPDSLGNLRPAHHACNSLRGDLDLGEWFTRHPLPHADRLTPSREW